MILSDQHFSASIPAQEGNCMVSVRMSNIGSGPWPSTLCGRSVKNEIKNTNLVAKLYLYQTSVAARCHLPKTVTWPSRDRSKAGALSLKALGEYAAAHQVDFLHSKDINSYPVTRGQQNQVLGLTRKLLV